MFHPLCRQFPALVCAILPVLMADVSSASADSGVIGTVLAGPTKGGPIRPGFGSLSPVREAEFVVRQGGKVILTFRTDREGRFEVRLAPGDYTVVPAQEKRRIGRCGPFTVKIRSGETAKVQWICDTGIR